MKIKPLADNLLIEPESAQGTTTQSGIVIPDTAKEKPQKGKVVAAGPGKKNPEGKVVSMEVKVGDVVYYKKWGGNEIKLDNKEYILIKEDDVLGILEVK